MFVCPIDKARTSVVDEDQRHTIMIKELDVRGLMKLIELKRIKTESKSSKSKMGMQTSQSDVEKEFAEIISK